jgi:hypothetical protein
MVGSFQSNTSEGFKSRHIAYFGKLERKHVHGLKLGTSSEIYRNTMLKKQSMSRRHMFPRRAAVLFKYETSRRRLYFYYYDCFTRHDTRPDVPRFSLKKYYLCFIMKFLFPLFFCFVKKLLFLSYSKTGT